VCQIHRVLGTLVRSWWLSGRASHRLIEDAAQTIQYWQQRNAAARRAHIKRTRQKLRIYSIRLKDCIRCKWP